MTGDAIPTSRDIENARVRRQIAARLGEEYAQAECLALEALGPGWTPWMKLALIASDSHRTGSVEPVATAYKVYRGEQRLTENAVYLRRMPNGRVRHAESYEPLFGELLHEPHPTRTILVEGRQVPCPRYSLTWSSLDLYDPRSAEQLAVARAKREQRAIEKETQAFPLFAEQIRADESRAQTRHRRGSPEKT